MQIEVGATCSMHGGIYLNRRVSFNIVRQKNVYCTEGKLSTGLPSCMLFSDGLEREAEKLGMVFESSESRLQPIKTSGPENIKGPSVNVRKNGLMLKEIR